MSIDVFIRVQSQSDEIRRSMQHLTMARWILEGAEVWYLEDMGIREGRMYAEKAASSDPYIVTDDDVLIMGKDWLERAVSVMLANPDYAIASTLSICEGENMAVPPREYTISASSSSMEFHSTVHSSPDIYEMHSVGAPMIIRKGTCKDLPEMDLNSECGEIHKMVLDSGKKEGLISGIRHNHLGNGFSSNPNLRWAY